MRAVHFGAGNIGRGFIGATLQDSGYFVTFADVNQELIRELNQTKSYRVIELGPQGKSREYSNFQALSSIADRDSLAGEISRADLITASVGANILPRIAELIAIGISQRVSETPVVVMACENAVNATDLLAAEILKFHDVESKALFCNTAVDRIVPMQPEGLSPSVEVEAFSEWVIETKNLNGYPLELHGAHLVADLSPFIERKLFTVNTAHCAAAYLGQQAGYSTIASALQDSKIFTEVEAVLAETSRVLIKKYGFDATEHAAYVSKTLSRLSSREIDDQVERVGRQPLRKLSKHERLIAPARFLAESGYRPVALLSAVAAALVFSNPEDPEVDELQGLLRDHSADQLVFEVCGVAQNHALFPELAAIFSARQSQLLAS